MTGKFELKPRIVLAVNMLFGNRGLLPGGFGLFAVEPAIVGNQFRINPGNTTVGFTVEGVSFEQFEIIAALDVNLKTPTPLLPEANVLAPQFYSAYIAARSDRLILRAGQFPDVILPFLTPTTNGFPGSYLPGQLGFTRPQLRADVRVPLSDRYQLLLLGSLSAPVQTFRLTDELFGVGAGIPDVQGRVVFAAGAPIEDSPWKRSYEVAMLGHAGQRTIVELVGDEQPTGSKIDTWSVGADLKATFPTKTELRLRIWSGSVLGDYAGGVFQTVSTELKTPIDAHGFVVSGTQHIAAAWRVNVGFGRDNPKDRDLGPGERTLNQAGFANVTWNWSRVLGFGLEVSRWRTTYKDLGSSSAWRGELFGALRLGRIPAQ